jgi:hypothetical protein
MQATLHEDGVEASSQGWDFGWDPGLPAPLCLWDTLLKDSDCRGEFTGLGEEGGAQSREEGEGDGVAATDGSGGAAAGLSGYIAGGDDDFDYDEDEEVLLEELQQKKAIVVALPAPQEIKLPCEAASFTRGGGDSGDDVGGFVAKIQQSKGGGGGIAPASGSSREWGHGAMMSADVVPVGLPGPPTAAIPCSESQAQIKCATDGDRSPWDHDSGKTSWFRGRGRTGRPHPEDP